MSVKKIFGAALIAGALVANSACSRVEENESALRIGVDGSIKKEAVGSEMICFLLCEPGARTIKYDTTPSTFTISSGAGASTNSEGIVSTSQSNQIFLRTADEKFVDSISIAIAWEVVPESGNQRLLYKEFKANDGNKNRNIVLVQDDLAILAVQPVVNAVMDYDALKIQENGEAIGEDIRDGLQAAVNKRLGVTDEASPVRIKYVTVSGVKFDPETEAVLREFSLAPERGRIAEEKAKAAQQEANGASAQAAVTIKTIEAMSQIDGVTPENLPTLVCLDQKRQGLQSQNTNCFPGIVTSPR